MNDELARLQAELEEIEQVIVASADLPAAQREVILAALRAQRDTLQRQIATLVGSGAIAQDHSVAVGEAGAAVGRDIHGDVRIVHYHSVESPDAATISHPKIYHNLPQPDYGTFVGREEELAQIHRLLLSYPRSRYHVISIDGIGGIGKSALALEAAYHYLHGQDILPENERFGAIIWTSAKQMHLTAEGVLARHADVHTLEDIYATIAGTLGRDDITQARPEERATVVAHALTDQRTLLVVDNLEAVDDEQVMAFIREVPDPTKVIVTTRQRIDVAYPIRLVEMPWEEAQILIAQECEKKGVSLTADQTLKLYDRTGGVPLALVWSIARVAWGDSVRNVLLRLVRPDSDIARFCFEGVVRPLRDNEAYQLLMASALFARDMSREALKQVAGIKDELSCADGLMALERLSLLNRHADRFSLLPLTRMYLDRELEQSSQFSQTAFERMLTYYKGLVQPPEDKLVGISYWDGLLVLDADEVQSLRPEWHNIAHILHRTLDEQRHADALALFLPIVHIIYQWGMWDERLALSREMCRAARKLNDPSEPWLWIDAIAWILYQRQQVGECLNALETGRTLANRFDLTEALLQAQAIEARLYSAGGDIALAWQLLDPALEQIDPDSVLKSGDKVRQIVAGRLFGTAAGLRLAEKDFDQARFWYGHTLEMRKVTGEYQAIIQIDLGHLSLQLKDIASAKEFFAEATSGANPKDEARIDFGRALIAEQEGRWQEAVQFCQLAMERFGVLGKKREIEQVRRLLARLQGKR